VGWQQLVVHVRAEDVARAETLLRLAGAAALAASDAGDDPLLEPAPGALPLWPHVELRALFAAGVDLERLRALVETVVPTEGASSIAVVEDGDWHTAWRERITALEFGSALAIVPADAPVGCRRFGCVQLHMGLAFGTGQHPTTALCLDWLTRNPPRQARVLDFGCGSGILALAALALGARRAWAVDHDPQALTATKDNADLNDRVAAIWVGPPEQLPAVEVDLVLANIIAGTLIELAPRFAALARPGATVVLSGLLADQRASVEAAYSSDFEAFEVATQEQWLRLTARRKSRSSRM
jgi:ribosomal protein L11 methyltransferase